MDDKQGISVTTEDMLQIIGELFVQTRLLQKLIRIKQEEVTNGAIKEREISSC